MEQVFKIHDHVDSHTGVTIDNYIQVGVLGYTDDVSITSLTVEEKTVSLTSICRGSREDVDMDINKGKTFNMVVQRHPDIALCTDEEILDVENKYKHACEFCDRKFKTP